MVRWCIGLPIVGCWITWNTENGTRCHQTVDATTPHPTVSMCIESVSVTCTSCMSCTLLKFLINLESSIPLHHPFPSVHSESYFDPLYIFLHTLACQCQRLGTPEINPTYLKLPLYKHNKAKRLHMFQSRIHYHYPPLPHIPHCQKSRHGPLKVLNRTVMIAPRQTKPSSIPELQERCMDMFTNVSVSSSNVLQSQNEFLNKYLTQRHSILIQILEHESLPANPDCANCHQSSGTHQCQDCFGHNLWCGPCCVSVHKNVPFHHVQM